MQLVSDSPSLASSQNDPTLHDRLPQNPVCSPTGDLYINEVATEHLIVSCPRCGADKQAAGQWLYRPNRKCHLHCTTCHRYPSARQWLCPCKIAWRTCPVHRGMGFRCKGGGIVRDMTKHKRAAHPRDFFERSRKTLRRLYALSPANISKLPFWPSEAGSHSMGL